jgi:glutathione S-transferase
VTKEDIFPLIIYGCDISYFTGKLENYFRLKGLPYTLHAMQGPADFKLVKQKTGVEQMPALQLGDGRWMTDSTKIIEWFEQVFPETSVVPLDPLQGFISLLLEDYADEWLWRPAMHYRWHYPEGAHHSSRHLVDELAGSIPLPGFLKRWAMRMRQRNGYTTGDGINADNVKGVEDIYLRSLQQLEAIFNQRPFLLGDKPSLADVGFAGPFFRHFGLDPVPQEIMRQQAPSVFEWIARLWNTKLESDNSSYVDGIPEDLGPLLDEIGNSYLPYLCANVDAVAAGKKRFDTEIGGVKYVGARYSRYRVWCLQNIRDSYNDLPEPVKSEAKELLELHNCWEPLWRHQQLPLLDGQEEGLPFKGDTKMVGANE